MRTSFIAAVTLVALSAPAAAQTRALAGFDHVSAADQLRVEITIAPGYSVQVTGADADRISTHVDDETLRIRQRNRNWFGNNRLDAVVRVSMPALTGIAASRGASVRAENVEARAMSLSAAMGGDIRITGACQNVSASASMGGVIDADGFRCQNADVSASMGGEARVNAQTAVDASASMGGTIDVLGSPATRETGSAMGGSIRVARN